MTASLYLQRSPSRRTLLAVGGAGVLTACAPGEAGSGAIRIGYQKSGVLLLAKSRGVVARTLSPLVVTWVEFPSGPPLLEALNAQAVDFGATGDAPPIFAEAAGAPIRYVAVQPLSGDGEAIVTPAHSTLTGVKDLSGKRIAFTKASSCHLLVVNALRSVGLTLAAVQPIYLSPSDAASAFARGAVDAWAIWDPYLALAQRDQKARVLISGAALPKSDAFYLSSKRFIDTRPAALSALLEALRQEAAWGESHRPQVVRLIAAANGLPAEIVETSLRRAAFAVDPMAQDVVARQQASADVFQSIGVIPAHVSISDAAWEGWKPRS